MKCKDCQYYIQHYILSEGRMHFVFCGHCTVDTPKGRRPNGKACGKFVPGEPDTAKLVTKKYLTKTLLDRVLSMELLPEIKDDPRNER